MRAFNIVSKSAGKALLKGGKVLARIDDIRAAPSVVVAIPVEGAVVAAAAAGCEVAGTMFGSGARRKEWATASLRMDLRRQGVEEESVDELVAVGLLVATGRAVVLEEPKLKGKPRGGHLASMPIGPDERARPEEIEEGSEKD